MNRYQPQAVISARAARRIASLLDAIDQIIAEEVDRPERADHAPLQLPDALRERALMLGSSVFDLTFWIRRDPDAKDGDEWYLLDEVESGARVEASSAREACESYFAPGWAGWR